MALPTGGSLSLSQIQLETGGDLNNVSLRSLSSAAGFSSPDAISEFYGWSSAIKIGTISVFQEAANFLETDKVLVAIVTSFDQKSFQQYYVINQTFALAFYNPFSGYIYEYNTYNFVFTDTFVDTYSQVYIYDEPDFAYPYGPPTLDDPFNLGVQLL